MTTLVAAAAFVVTSCGDIGPQLGEREAVPESPSSPQPSPNQSPQPEAPGPGLHELAMTWDGEERTYLVDAASDYDPRQPTPLIVVLHAGRSAATVIRERSGLDQLAQEHGVLVVYPQGVGGWWRPPLDGEHGVAVDWEGDPIDVEFLKQLVAHLIDEWNVSPGQVYATGHSNGAAMTYRLAAEAADVFTAIAPVGGYIVDPPASIEPAQPVSVVGFVGQSSKYTEEIAEGLEIWRSLLECVPGDPTVTEDQGVTRTAAQCRDGSKVVQYDIEGMGHVWPRESAHGVDANDAMWEFFLDHARKP